LIQKGNTPIASAKWAPSVRHSAKLLIPQVKWLSIKSDSGARRDSLSLRYWKWRVSGAGEIAGRRTAINSKAGCLIASDVRPVCVLVIEPRIPRPVGGLF